MHTGVMSVGTLTADQVRSVLAAASAAPAPHRGRPCRVHCTPTTIEVHANPAGVAGAADPDRRGLLLGCGAALLNLRLAISAEEVYPDVSTLPDPNQPNLLAVIHPQSRRPATPTDHDLAAAIGHRRTNHQPFAPGAITSSVRDELRRAAELERAWLATLSPPQLPALSAIVQRAHLAQPDNPAITAPWATGGESDGGDGEGANGPVPEGLLRDFGARQASAEVAADDGAPDPLIAVIGTLRDQPGAHLQAGQATQRVLLTATAAGLSASFLPQALQLPATRRELRDLLGGGLWPQTVLRLVHAAPVLATPPPDVQDVMAPAEPLTATTRG